MNRATTKKTLAVAMVVMPALPGILQAK